MEISTMATFKKISTFILILAMTACTIPAYLLNTSYRDDDSHSHTPHAGVIAAFTSNGIQSGFAEVKLHDDKGDVELWLTKDLSGTVPFDLPLDSIITLSLPNIDQQQITLQIRNSDANEDEDGNGTIRNKQTNYFIFPGRTEAEASFLMGRDFITQAIVSFEVNGIFYTSKTFDLYPHTH